MKNKFFVFASCIFLVFVSGCSKKSVKAAEAADAGLGYSCVSMEEGLRLMQADKDYVLLDVRTESEFKSGHIPGAVLHTNELMTLENTLALIPDMQARIYVYCRSGRRSKIAVHRLAEYGYTHIIEIGGINSYMGLLEK